ncbi:hypothetical protein ACOME3_007259 [Neoechinorhynchus agilis]
MSEGDTDQVNVNLIPVRLEEIQISPRMYLSSENVNTWKSDFVYILSIVGFVVDLGNFWRFPTTCYNNGGGAFLIPYFFFIIVIGIPLVCLELSLGQVFKTANIHVWDYVCPWIKGIGFTVILINLCIQSYYNTIIAWALHFALASLQTVLPWSPEIFSSTNPNQTYFVSRVLHSEMSAGIHDIGGIQTDLLPLLILVFVAVFASIYKGAHSIGKAVYVTALLP